MAKKYLDNTGLALVWAKIKELVSTKVDKVEGKGLSSNDYTSDEKTKLAGVAANAQVNVLEGIQKNGDTVTVTNKIANISVPTKTSDITNDSGFITSASLPAATTTTPKMDGTAAVGSETTWAKGDHVHPSDTTRVPTTRKVNGHALSADVTVSKGDVGLGNVDNTADANKEVLSATKLKTARTIDGVSFDGQANIIHYGTCGTAAATAEKAVDCTGFALATGAEITIKFTTTNTAAVANLKLNVNSTGAKAIKYRGANLSAAGVLTAGRTYKFVYDGTNYELIGDLDTDHTYTAASAAPLMDGTAAVGSSAKYAREDHVHPSDTTKVDVVEGKGLSTNDYTDAEKTKLSGIATGAEVNQNAFSNIAVGSTTIVADGKTDTLTLASGDNITLTPDASTDTITISAATYADVTAGGASGLMSGADKTKLDGIATGAEVNQNAFSTIKVGSTNVSADSKTDTVTFAAGDNITITPNASTDTITISATDTTYTPASATPLMDGTAAVGTSAKYAREDHVHPSDTSRVPTTRKVNNKALSADITLTASDVSAVATSAVGAANGVCPLNANSVIDATYLPSFVDDIIEAYARTGATALASDWLSTTSASGSALTPETGKIYVLMSDSGDYAANTQFRWSGTSYVKLNDGGVSPITNEEINTICV